MFCNKKNVNLLTALLQTHSIHHIVICPAHAMPYWHIILTKDASRCTP